MARIWEGACRWRVAGGRISIVTTFYHRSITERLLEGAQDVLAKAGVPDDAVDVVWVPGAWEIPVAARACLGRSDTLAVICLGCVIRGETTHDQHISGQVSRELGRLATDFVRPVTFGVLTCQSMEQALARAGGPVGNKGAEAAEAALMMVDLLQCLPPEDGRRTMPAHSP